MILKLVSAAAVALLSAGAANAVVTYTFNGVGQFDGDGVQEAATFVVMTPSPITVDATPSATSCTLASLDLTCNDPSFSPGTQAGKSEFGGTDDFVGFNYSSNNGGGDLFYFFQSGALSRNGVYSDANYPQHTPCCGDGGLATLTVTGAAVPEPAAWALMIVGVGGLGLTLRRRRMSAPLTA